MSQYLDHTTQANITDIIFSAADYFNKGNDFQQLKNLTAALQCYEKATELQPDFAEAWWKHGNTQLFLENYSAAISSYQQAITQKPDYAEAYSNLGIALQKLSRFEAAIENFQLAIQLKPDYANAYNNCGLAYKDLKQHSAELSCYEKAIAINPKFAEAFNNYGNALLELKHYELALANYERAISITPEHYKAHKNIGNVWLALKNFKMAAASYQHALKLNPDYAFLFGTYLRSKLTCCDWQNIDLEIAELTTKLKAGCKVTTPFDLLAISGDPALQRQAAEIWASDKFSETDSVPQVWHSKHDKIRIAYFSADFRNHPVAILMAGMYENHDKSQFELIGFSFTHERDEMTARLENAFDQFIDVQNLSDQEIVELARMLEIDIAVDLGGYTGDGGSACFAMRVAPIQISYLGYSGTMGVNYIDYLLADEFLIPKTSQQYYSEKMIYLPDCYLVNDNTRKISNHKFCRQELGLPETGFVFCCFNNEYKYTPTTFSCWMRILNQVKDSVLWLAEGNPFVAENLRQAAIQQGISAARLIFARRLPDIGQHLARQRLADLFLDTLPYNAHTTSCDALWAGLPVLTCAGEVYAARVAASLLNAMNLPELITARMEDYEARAIELATQPEKLRAIKAKLALNRLRAPLFDTPLFTRHIETAFFEVHARFRGGLTPEHVYIQKQESAGNSQPGYV